MDANNARDVLSANKLPIHRVFSLFFPTHLSADRSSNKHATDNTTTRTIYPLTTSQSERWSHRPQSQQTRWACNETYNDDPKADTIYKKRAAPQAATGILRVTRRMTTDAARRAVFETAELLEQIMLELPGK